MRDVISFRFTSRFRRMFGAFGLMVALAPKIFSAEQAEPEFVLRSWDRRDGLPATLITHIQRTANGYLWLATERGLVRFDGARFKVMDLESSLRIQTNRVNGLLADSAGGLWAGTEQGLFHFPEGWPTAVENAVEIGSRLSVKALAAGPQGALWVLAANNEVFLVSHKNILKRFKIPGTQPMRSAVSDQQRNLMAASPYEASLLENGQFVKLPAEILGTIKPDTIYPKQNGGFWASFGSDIADLEKSEKEFNLVWHAAQGEFPQTAITVLMEDRMGRLWAGTRLGAVHYYQKQVGWRQVTPQRSRSLGGISCLYEDGEGLIWAGTIQGNLHQIKPRLVTSWPLPIIAPDGVPQTVCVTQDGTVWAGTDGAGAFRYKDKIISRFGVEQGLSNTTVIAIFEDQQTNLWFGTLSGLFRLEGETFKPELESILSNQPVPSLYQDKAGNLWFGATGAVVRKRGSEVQTFSLGSSFSDKEVRAIVEGPKGEIWIGTYGGGLFRLQNDQIERQNRFTRPVVQTMYCDREGVLWIGTTARGLFRIKNNSLRNWTKSAGLPSDWVHSILEDSNGILWLGSNDGIFGVSKQALMGQVRSRKSPLLTIHVAASEVGNWSASSGQPSAARSADGRLWFPLGHGLLSFNPAELMRTRPSLPVLVEEVLADGVEKAFNSASPVQIYSGVKRLEFRYTIADLDSPGQLKFRYMLEGIDEKWVDGGVARSASYGLLPEGKYRFRVISAGSGNVWTETANPVTIEIVPHFWQTAWFHSLIAVVIFGSVAGVVRFVERARMRQKLARLQAHQNMERERQRIAQDLHDDLGSGITEIMLLSELAKRDEGPREEIRAQLDGITNKARQVATSMDQIVWTVNPKNDSLPDLSSYLCDYAQEFLRAGGIRCRIDVDENIPSLPITAQQRHNLFLAVKEALNNAVKHSGADEVWLRISSIDGKLMIAVEDNGCGFESEAQESSGNGLRNMKARLESIHGKIEFSSGPGRGTKISFSVKLDASGVIPTAESLN